MTWLTDLVTIAGPAGLISAAATHALAGWRDRRTSRRQGCYLALRVAIILERFAGECLDVVTTIDAAAETNGDPSTFPTRLPLVPDYPDDDLGWRDLDASLANRALTLIVERNAAQAMVNEDRIYFGSTSAPFECSRLAAILGLQAWDVAVDLRSKYGLPPYTPRAPFHQTLFKRVRKDERERQKSAEHMRKFLETPSEVEPQRRNAGGEIGLVSSSSDRTA